MPVAIGSESRGQTTGNSSPLGATVVDGGVNFSLFSREARQAWSCCSLTGRTTRGRRA